MDVALLARTVHHNKVPQIIALFCTVLPEDIVHCKLPEDIAHCALFWILYILYCFGYYTLCTVLDIALFRQRRTIEDERIQLDLPIALLFP